MNDLKKVIQQLKEELANFEEREEQLEMMESVYNAMMKNEKVAVHAPTGTGKSLGYLIAYVAVKLQRPDFVISISTYSLSLQEQLQRDLEVANNVYVKLTGKSLRAIPLKGRSNYFCHSRFDRALDEESLSVKTNESLLENIPRNRWDRQNLNVTMSNEEWNKVKTETCLEKECPYTENCTYYQSYFDKTYDIYVVNHSLFMARFLYVAEAWEHIDFMIFDESHKLEKVMLDSNTYELSLEQAEYWSTQGHTLATEMGVDREKANIWIRQKFYEHRSIATFRQLNENILAVMTGTTESCATLKIDLTKMKRFLLMVSRWQQELFSSWEELFSEEMKESPRFKEDKNVYGANLGGFAEFLSLSNHEEEKAVIWFEKKEKGQLLYKVTPKSISEIKSPFQKGLLFTSGTLAQGGTCSPLAARIGITLDRENVMSTPFSLAEQTCVYVSSDINPNARNYEVLLAERILELIKMGDGKTFVLFTSTELMKSVYNRLRDSLYLLAYQFDQPMRVWLQEKDNYKAVIDSFQTPSVRSILFGTLTYFEGIDLKDKALTQIILTRLPYSVPNHPVQQILDRNHNYSHWEAVIRFEQAFGRLIRTQNDYGSFSVLDNRLLGPRFKSFMDIIEKENIPFSTSIGTIKEFHTIKK